MVLGFESPVGVSSTTHLLELGFEVISLYPDRLQRLSDSARAVVNANPTRFTLLQGPWLTGEQAQGLLTSYDFGLVLVICNDVASILNTVCNSRSLLSSLLSAVVSTSNVDYFLFSTSRYSTSTETLQMMTTELKSVSTDRLSVRLMLTEDVVGADPYMRFGVDTVSTDLDISKIWFSCFYAQLPNFDLDIGRVISYRQKFIHIADVPRVFMQSLESDERFLLVVGVGVYYNVSDLLAACQEVTERRFDLKLHKMYHSSYSTASREDSISTGYVQDFHLMYTDLKLIALTLWKYTHRFRVGALFAHDLTLCKSVYNIKPLPSVCTAKRNFSSQDVPEVCPDDLAIAVITSRITGAERLSYLFDGWLTKARQLGMEVRVYSASAIHGVHNLTILDIPTETHSARLLSFMAMQHLITHSPKKKWYMKADDDIFIFPTNLMFALSLKRSLFPIHDPGCQHLNTPGRVSAARDCSDMIGPDWKKMVLAGRIHTNGQTLSGGAGILLSRGLAQAISDMRTFFTDATSNTTFPDIGEDELWRKAISSFFPGSTMYNINSMHMSEPELPWELWEALEPFDSFPSTFHWIRTAASHEAIARCSITDSSTLITD